jgi:hypothetical protein
MDCTGMAELPRPSGEESAEQKDQQLAWTETKTVAWFMGALCVRTRIYSWS